MRLSAEEECVLLCVAAARTAAEEDRLLDLLRAQVLDWSSLWEKAMQLEVEPLVARAITTPGPASVLPSAVLDQAKSVRLQTMAYNMANHAELLRVAKELAARGIPTTPLKGTHVAERLFGALDARKVGDIDLLVPESQLEEGRAALCDLGYAMVESSADSDDHPFHGAPWIRQGQGRRFVVELHWKLTDPRFVTIDYPALWRRILHWSPDESLLRPLPSEETLAYLALHLCKESGGGILRLLGDIDRLIRVEGPELDWPYLLGLAERWNGAWQLYFALYRSQLLFGTPVPREPLDRVTPKAWRRALISLLAGPRAILRPTSSRDLYYHKFRLAYCAALSPVSRSFDAYAHFFFPARPGAHPMGVVRRTINVARALISGARWTGLCLVESLYGLVAPPARQLDRRSVR